MDHWTARALLEWQLELGADEAILDGPLDRYGLPDAVLRPVAAPAAPRTAASPDPAPRPDLPAQVRVDAVAMATQAAAAASDLEALCAAMAGFAHCDLRKGARNLVFADGDPGARVMIVGEAPGREEDAAGVPFAGRAGQLLDRMLGAVGMGRAGGGPAAENDSQRAVYLVPVLPWRPPADRSPTAGEIAVMLPFLIRHIELADPEILVLMGNTPCQALLGRQGITRLRGAWTQALDRPTLPMVAPDALLGRPEAKRDAWADLLSLAARLEAPA